MRSNSESPSFGFNESSYWARLVLAEMVVLGRAAMGETVGQVRFRDRREIRFAGALTGFPESVLDGLGSSFAAFALEPIGLDGDFAGG